MGLNSGLCIRGFRSFCILLIVALLCPTCLCGENLLIAIPILARVGLVSFDSYDSFIPASGCWFLVSVLFMMLLWIRNHCVRIVLLCDGEGSLSFYYLVVF